MAKNTSFVLGDHFDTFVTAQIEAGRYANAADVIRSGLRILEEHEKKVAALRDALIEGENSGPDGPLDMEQIIRRARAKAGVDA
jgi:antitoxin ParD1/3/4